jgi:hypothetical protein
VIEIVEKHLTADCITVSLAERFYAAGIALVVTDGKYVQIENERGDQQ